MTSTEDRVAELVEEATRLAGNGEGVAAGVLALEAAALLPAGDPDRHSVFSSAGSLLAAAGQHAVAADAWAGAASDAMDDMVRARDLTAEGKAARLAGMWWRAVDCHERALALAGASHGSSVDTAIIAQNLAMTFKYTGRFDEAEQLYRRALAIAENCGERQVVAAICHNLGGLAHARGDHAAGIPWARRSVQEREPLDDPVGLAADRGALAGLLIGAGQLDEAGRLLDAARHVFVEHLGEDHHEVGVVDGNLAAVALARDDLVAAERHARAALGVKERHLGPEHPELAVTLTTLGTIRRRRGDRREAAQLHRRALAVLRLSVVPGHPVLRTIEDNLMTATSDARFDDEVRPDRIGDRNGDCHLSIAHARGEWRFARSELPNRRLSGAKRDTTTTKENLDELRPDPVQDHDPPAVGGRRRRVAPVGPDPRGLAG